MWIRGLDDNYLRGALSLHTYLLVLIGLERADAAAGIRRPAPAQKKRPPAVGEGAREVLAGLGYSAEKIGAMAAAGVIALPG